MKTIVKPLFLICLVFGLCIDRGDACTCAGSPSPCQSFLGTPVVFVGLVKSIEEQHVDIQRFGTIEKVRVGLTAHFVIEEALKGITETEVDVATGGGGGDCGYNFKAGERYLVYAYKSDAEALESSMSRTVFGSARNPITKKVQLSANICGRTRPLAQAQDDIDLIRSILKGRSNNRIFGIVDEYFSKLGESLTRDGVYKPVVGLTIKAQGAAGKYETTTDSEGRFRLNDLKPGKYRVWPVIPAGFGMQFSFERRSVDVEVTRGCWAEEFAFTIKVDGRLSGRVYDAEGKPVGKQVQLSIKPYEPEKETEGAESRSEYTDKDGRYEFYGVPVGRYVLGVNIADVPDKGTPYPRTFYPDGNRISSRCVLTLAHGQKMVGLDIYLPPALGERLIEGVVLKEDGAPAIGAKVHLYDSERPNDAVFGLDAEVDGAGHFEIKAYKERRYYLRSYLAVDYLAGIGTQSDLIEVDSSAKGLPLKVVLNKPGIFLKRN